MWRSVLDNRGIRYRPLTRWMILILLALIIASPFSSGDKGLWLGFAPAPIDIFEALDGHFAAEESTLLRVRSDLAPCSLASGLDGFDRGIALDDVTMGLIRSGCRGWSYPIAARPAPPDPYAAPSSPRGPPT
jgi:hypothetical protein